MERITKRKHVRPFTLIMTLRAYMQVFPSIATYKVFTKSIKIKFKEDTIIKFSCKIPN